MQSKEIAEKYYIPQSGERGKMTTTQIKKYLEIYKSTHEFKTLFECYSLPSIAKLSIYEKFVNYMHVYVVYRTFDCTTKERILDFGILTFNKHRFTFGFTTLIGSTRWLYAATNIDNGFWLCGVVD